MLAVLVTVCGTKKVRAHSRWWDPVTWKGPLGVLCVGTRYGGIHLPTFVILFRQYINRNIMSHVARWMESGCGLWMWFMDVDVDVDNGFSLVYRF